MNCESLAGMCFGRRLTGEKVSTSHRKVNAKVGNGIGITCVAWTTTREETEEAVGAMLVADVAGAAVGEPA